MITFSSGCQFANGTVNKTLEELCSSGIKDKDGWASFRYISSKTGQTVRVFYSCLLLVFSFITHNEHYFVLSKQDVKGIEVTLEELRMKFSNDKINAAPNDLGERT